MPHMVWSFQSRFVVVVVGSLSAKIVAHWLFVPVGPFCFHSLHCILYTSSLLPLPSIPISKKISLSFRSLDKDGGAPCVFLHNDDTTQRRFFVSRPDLTSSNPIKKMVEV